MKRLHLPPAGFAYLIIAIALCCGSTIRVLAQDSAMNKRGFQPGNSYAVGDFESINMVNGNVGLRFPLATLPVGRNGLTASINLLYNSKLYDSEIAYFRDESQSCQVQGGDPPEGVLVCPYYQKRLLKPSEDGGWRYGMSYSLKLIDRHDELANVPPEERPQCFFSGVYGGLTPGYYELRYRYKLLLVFPDGSSHEMRPNGWSDGNFNDPLADYFDIRPDGLWDTCQSGPTWYPNTITYFSTDGTFLRLDIQHDSDDYWWNNPWTLYFPDGSRVTGGNAPQRIYDRNDNYVQINFIENYDGTGYGASQIVDQLNRSITLTSDGTEDLIISQGFGGTYTWKVRGGTIRVQKSYWPCESLSCPWQVQQQDVFGMTFWMVDRITLPSQAGSLTYTFSYNAPFYTPGDPYVDSLGWGELSGITLPTGAHADYSYVQNGTQPYSATSDILRNSPTSKVLTYTQEYDGASTPLTETWSYTIDRTGSSITGPDGGTNSQSFIDTQGAFWNSGQIYATVNPDGSKTETIWAWNDLASNFHANQYPKTVFTSIKSAAGTYVKTAIKDYKYDKNGNVTRVAEYDWMDYASVPRDAQGMPTGIPSISPTRVTSNTYFNTTPDATQLAGSNTNVYWSSGSPRVKNAIASAEVRRILTSGGEDPVTRVEYTYDNPSVPANLTQVRMWDSTKGGYSNPLTIANSLTATTQYNQYGMPTLVTDARGLKTLTTYGQIGSVSDLYPTQIKIAYQTAQERTETREYDFGTGLVTRVTDMDNDVSTFNSFDVFGRPALTRAAEGKTEETETTYEYSDSLRRVITRSEFAGSDKLVSIEHFDQLGRVRLSRQLETAAESATNEEHGIKVQTRYRFSGANSFLLVSNPYRAATSNGAGSEQTMGWTRSKSDNAGRTVEVQTFGGAGLPAPWGLNTTSTGTIITAYDANFTTVTDQAQKQRRSVTDALGRLIRVDEPLANNDLGSTTSPNQPTHYSYDVLGNLTKVTQSDSVTTQNRDFVYSSLSRLTSAINPESGTIAYHYDESGNLLVKTDARGVSVHYAYDWLNRLTRRWYNGSNSLTETTHNNPALPVNVGATEEVKFYYDAQSLPAGAPSYSRGSSMGRLVAQTYGSGSNGDYFAYDPLGRPTLKIQQIGTVNYQMSASYNLGSAITSLTYPSGHTIANSYDQAGRLTALSGNLGDGTTRTYSSGILYSSNGALEKEQIGTITTPIYNKLFYNSRGQLAEIRASTSYTGPTDYSADRGAIVNNYSSQCTGICYGSSMPDNNGNLLKQEIHIPSQQMRWQQYEYDSLNRLGSAREVLDGGAEQWKQQFIYDRWGNRRIDTTATYGTGINNKAFNANPTNNRLEVPAGQTGVMQYDAVGNLINDTYTGAGNRAYDGENKITSAWGGNNQAQLYGYDAAGQRIKRKVDGLETWQVYGLGGELLAEYSANGAVNSPQKEYGYRNGQLLVTAEPSIAAPTNVALASNGATATASSSYSGWGPGGAIDGDRKGLFVWQNGAWSTAVAGFPAWLEVQFNGSKTISEIDVITLQDNYNAPIEPTESMTFSLYGSSSYDVQYWSGSAWVTISGGSVSGNNKVWKKFSFSPITTTGIRVLCNASPDGVSRLTEVEAWTGPSPAPRYNLALAATATASSVYSAQHAASAVINGDRKGLNAGNGGNWQDAPPANSFPDWLQIDFGTNKTIDEVDVFSLQDNWTNPVEPTESMTFTLYGMSGFDVQYWDGSNWVTVPGGAITGNNKVWRKVTFSPVTTSKIRILTNAGPYGYSVFTEVEAYAPAETGSTAGLHWLVSDHLGTPRMVFDQTGNLPNMKRHDYLPFGEELFAPAGGRTVAMGYSGGDRVRQQFTSKERDVETGLDYFLARYYSSTQGRFTSADEPLVGQDEDDPQTWNLYSYTSGNPLNRIDPDGDRWFYKCDGRNGCDVQWVNPNEDGSYTSPGEGYTAFVPTRGDRWLFVWNEDGTRVLYLGEKDDGSPDVRNLAVGRTENASWDIVGVFIPGKLTFKGLIAGASALWARHLAKKAAKESFEEALEQAARKAPVGRRGQPLKVPVKINRDATIGGRRYTGHALDQMQSRGITPSVVEDTIARGARSPGRGGATIFKTEQAKVIVNPNGSIKTVITQ